MKSHSDNSAIIEHHRRQLSCWLWEWQLDCNLRAAPDGEAKAEPAVHFIRRASGLTAMKKVRRPATSQIRLLWPVGCDESPRPLYVAVLLKLCGDAFLIAPFSRFSEPATPGEWITGLKALPARVLCLWNARVVSSSSLACSWIAGNMTKQQTNMALEVYLHAQHGNPLVTVPETCIGPPVRHPLDPRYRYMAGESDLLQESIRTLEEKVESDSRDGILYGLSPSRRLLAAEERAGYGGSKRRKRTGKDSEE